MPVEYRRTKVAVPALIDDYQRELYGQGNVFLPAAIPDDLMLGEPGHCFDNCLLAALGSRGKYLYCEGIGILDNEAYVHAWLTDKDRKLAYELTWRAVDDKTGKVVPLIIPAVYKGHVLDIAACRDYVLSTGTAGVVCNRKARPRLYKEVLKASGLL
jgi:hypothetical protein